MRRVAIALASGFLICSVLLTAAKDGEIFLALLAWPASLLMGAICDRAGNFCMEGPGLYISLAVLGCIQWLVIGWTVGFGLRAIGLRRGAARR